MRALSLALGVALVASAVSAADSNTTTVPKRGTLGAPIGQSSTNTTNSNTSLGSETTMGALLSQGYTIRAAVPNGGKFIVFMQKDQSAYACEFESLTGARCGSIN